MCVAAHYASCDAVRDASSDDASRAVGDDIDAANAVAHKVVAGD